MNMALAAGQHPASCLSAHSDVEGAVALLKTLSAQTDYHCLGLTFQCEAKGHFWQYMAACQHCVWTDGQLLTKR